MVPPNHPYNRVFHYKPSILGVPLFLETPILSEMSQLDPESSEYQMRIVNDTSFGKNMQYPLDPCMIFLPTFTIQNQLNVGKYTSPMNPMG